MAHKTMVDVNGNICIILVADSRLIKFVHKPPQALANCQKNRRHVKKVSILPAWATCEHVSKLQLVNKIHYLCAYNN